ncbi:hypothetical protein ABZP36_024516 [Zizania latifolia]
MALILALPSGPCNRSLGYSRVRRKHRNSTVTRHKVLQDDIGNVRAREMMEPCSMSVLRLKLGHVPEGDGIYVPPFRRQHSNATQAVIAAPTDHRPSSPTQPENATANNGSQDPAAKRKGIGSWFKCFY